MSLWRIERLASHTLVLAALAVAVTATAGCDFMRDPHERGMHYLKVGDYEKAFTALDEAVADAEASGDEVQLAIALANRSYANDALGRHEEALADATASLEITPDDPEVLNNRGVVLINLRRYDEAKADIDRAIELQPEYAAAFANRGRLHIDREAYMSAMDDLDRAIELDPALGHAFANRAVVFEALDDIDAALEDYALAVELDPLPEVHFSRGMLLYRYMRYEDAYDDFKTAADMSPESYLGYRAQTQVDFLEEFIKNLPDELRPPTPEPTVEDGEAPAATEESEG